MDAELREQPTPDEGAYDSNEKIADNPKPGALHDLAGQPSGDEADHQYNQETFTRHIHLRILSDIAGQISTRSGNASPINRDSLAASKHSGRRGTILDGPVKLRPLLGEDCAELLTSRGRDRASAICAHLCLDVWLV